MINATELKFTQELKDKWLARLRDPNSEQERGAGMADGETRTTDPTYPMCCLVHLQQVAIGVAFVGVTDRYELGYGQLAEQFFGEETKDKLIHMNDTDKLTLPQIADWVEVNVPVQE